GRRQSDNSAAAPPCLPTHLGLPSTQRLRAKARAIFWAGRRPIPFASCSLRLEHRCRKTDGRTFAAVARSCLVGSYLSTQHAGFVGAHGFCYSLPTFAPLGAHTGLAPPSQVSGNGARSRRWSAGRMPLMQLQPRLGPRRDPPGTNYPPAESSVLRTHF